MMSRGNRSRDIVPRDSRRRPLLLVHSMKARFVSWLLLVNGCAAVHPWEREHLAARAMRDPFVGTELSGAYASKVIESKTGGGLAGTAPGGGCGCTQ